MAFRRSLSDCASLYIRRIVFAQQVDILLDDVVWFVIVPRSTEFAGGIHLQMEIDLWLGDEEWGGVGPGDPRVEQWFTQIAKSLAEAVQPDQGCVSEKPQVNYSSPDSWGVSSVVGFLCRVSPDYYTTFIRERHGSAYWLGPELISKVEQLKHRMTTGSGIWLGAADGDPGELEKLLSPVGAWANNVDPLVEQFNSKTAPS
jgi:hypothetical protein